MTIRFVNKGIDALSQPLHGTDTSLHVVNAANLKPSGFINGTDTIYLQLVALNGGVSVTEYMIATAYSGNTITVVRAQENSTTLSAPKGTAVYADISAGVAANLVGWNGGVVTGSSTFAPPTGVGATFSPAAGYANISLTPSATAGPPTTGTHATGDVMMDVNGDLFSCIAGGSGTSVVWKNLGNPTEVELDAWFAQYGGAADGVADCAAARDAMLAYYGARNGCIVRFRGSASGYYFSTPWTAPGSTTNAPGSGLNFHCPVFVIDGSLGGGYRNNNIDGRTTLLAGYNQANGSVFQYEYAWVSGGGVFLADQGSTNSHLYIEAVKACIAGPTVTTVSNSGGDWTSWNINGTGLGTLSDGWWYLDLDPTDGPQLTQSATVWYDHTHGYSYTPGATIQPSSVRVAKFQTAGGVVMLDQKRPRIQTLRGRIGSAVDWRPTSPLIMKNLYIKRALTVPTTYNQGTFDTSAMVKVTNAQLIAENCKVQGLNGVTADLMPMGGGFQIGGQSSPYVAPGNSESITAYSPGESSIGCQIENCSVQNTARPIYFGPDANTAFVRGCSINSNNGNFKAGGIVMEGGAGTAGATYNTVIGNYLEGSNFAYPNMVISGNWNEYFSPAIDGSYVNLAANLTTASTSIQIGAAGVPLAWSQSLNHNPLQLLGAHMALGGAWPTTDQWEMLVFAEPRSAQNTGITGSTVTNGTITQTGTNGPLTLSGSGVASGGYLIGQSPATQEWVEITVSGTTATITLAMDAFGNIRTDGKTTNAHNGHFLQTGTWTIPLMQSPAYNWTGSGSTTRVSIMVAGGFDGPGNTGNRLRIGEMGTRGTFGQPVWNVNEGGSLNAVGNDLGDSTLIETAYRFRNPVRNAEWPGGLMGNRPAYTGYSFDKFFASVMAGSGPWGSGTGTGVSNGFLDPTGNGVAYGSNDPYTNGVGSGVSNQKNGVEFFGSRSDGTFLATGIGTVGGLAAQGTTFPVNQNQYSAPNAPTGAGMAWVSSPASTYSSGNDEWIAFDFASSAGRGLSSGNHHAGACPTNTYSIRFAMTLSSSAINEIGVYRDSLETGASLANYRKIAHIPMTYSGGVWSASAVVYDGGDTSGIQVALSGSGLSTVATVYVTKPSIAIGSSTTQPQGPGCTFTINTSAPTTSVFSGAVEVDVGPNGLKWSALDGTSAAIPSALLPKASSSVFGAVEVDNSTITAAAGVISIPANVPLNGSLNAGRDAWTAATAPTLAYGAGAGTSPPGSPTLATGSNDVRGQVLFGTGTATASGGVYVAVTFGSSTLHKSNLLVELTWGNNQLGSFTLHPQSISTTGFSICMSAAAPISQGATAIAVNYRVTDLQ